MTVSVERCGSVLTVINNRPEARNAGDPQTSDDLHQAFLDFEKDDFAQVAVLWGAGGAFCAGWDLNYAASLADSGKFRREMVNELAFPADGAPPPRGPLGPTRLRLSKPVIAAIEGPAVAGGMELALWCDIRVMAESAYLGVYCRRWGIPLLDGGTVRLPRLVGRGRALDIILTGRKVTAAEAERIGLCERVVAHGQARAAAEALGQEIARFPQAATRADRASVYATETLSEMRALEHEWQHGLAAHEREGAAGAERFARGLGRHGDFARLE